MKSTVTILIVAKNEAENIHEILHDIEVQTYPLVLIDLILVDSNSDDLTKKVMLDYAKNHKFREVRVLDNPKGTLAPGWNIGFEECRTDYIVRLDAHASISNNFIEESVKLLDLGESVVGGPRPNVINPKYRDDFESKVLLAVESALFGSGFAYYRNGEEERDVKSVFHGMLKKEVIDRVGRLNESLGRTEDNEYYYRVRKAGYNIKYSPQIVSYQYVRESFKAMCHQKYYNGYWIGKTLKVAPQCVSLFHLAPLFLLIFTVLSLILALWNPVVLCILVPYVALVIWNAVEIVRQHHLPLRTTLKIVRYFITLHFLYGWGTLKGLLNGKK